MTSDRGGPFNPSEADAALVAFLRSAAQDSGIELPFAHGFNQISRDVWVNSKAAGVSPGASVLDVGAGTSPYRQCFSHCDYKAHDFARYDGYHGSEGVYGALDYVSDITSLPIPDAEFDVVLCTEVLEHVPTPIDALKEMVRVLKPGGSIFLTAPLGSGLHQEPFHFYGGYTDHWYKKFLAEFNCDVCEIAPNHGYFAHLAQECARFSWTFEQHKHLHGTEGELLSELMGSLLPRYLLKLDQDCFIRAFTVGFHVEAKKRV